MCFFITCELVTGAYCEYSCSFNAFQAFVSEYAVTGKDAGTGSLLAALAEAGFLLGLEKNRLLKMDYFYFFYLFSFWFF